MHQLNVLKVVYTPTVCQPFANGWPRFVWYCGLCRICFTWLLITHETTLQALQSILNLPRRNHLKLFQLCSSFTRSSSQIIPIVILSDFTIAASFYRYISLLIPSVSLWHHHYYIYDPFNHWMPHRGVDVEAVCSLHNSNILWCFLIYWSRKSWLIIISGKMDVRKRWSVDSNTATSSHWSKPRKQFEKKM